ncbi:MAG: branched-chain amino acid ABC transporter permease, partial [Candidatus Hydrogenedentes bacterium]|nr:branched-chain amino acid ABC transporter permease [Candidatus Hydrogenedentota bacterium]
VFSPAALKLIASASLGLTRRINILCDKSLLAAFAGNTHQITAAHVKAAIRDAEFRRASAPRLGLWLGGAAAALFGLIFGLTAVRIKGFYLALTTIAAQILFHFLVLNLPSSWLGGANGITLEPASLFGLSFDTDRSIYYLCLVVACVMVAGAYGVIRSRHGRAFYAVRDDDVASGMMGIDVVRTKAMAFL